MTTHIWKCKDGDKQYTLDIDEQDMSIYPELLKALEGEYQTLLGLNDHEHQFTNVITLPNQVLHICRGRVANEDRLASSGNLL